MVVGEKLVVIVTHGPNEPELATIPFVMAGAALASDVAVVVALQADGVDLARTGVVETVAALGFPPLTKLLADVLALGGQLLVCSPCLKPRDLVPADLIEGAEVVAAGRLVAEITSATNTLTY